MTVTFCGHSEIACDYEVTRWLEDICEKLIRNGADTFFLGGIGDFDKLCKKVLLKLKGKYKNIEIILILPSLNHKLYTEGYDSTIYPELELAPARFTILKRNEWMVNNF